VDFGELNDKAIKGLMILSKTVSRFSLCIHGQPLMYLFMDEYFGSHFQRQVYGARLHEFIEREQDDECTHHGSKNWKLAYPLSIKISHLKRCFQIKG
jgi:hypothetical protein